MPAQAVAQYGLGCRYRSGNGVEKDINQAAHWFQKAAEQGHIEAQYILGSSYYNGLGLEKNITQAIFWLKKASEQGHKDSEKLALQIEQEEAQRQKEEQMKNAATQGDSQAQFDCGDLLYQKNDHKQCVSWFQKAADQGHIEAQYRLAASYQNGIGTKKDFDQAIYWAKKASKQGHKNAEKLVLQVEEIKAVSYDVTLW
jgi:TPR repeat protein